LQLWSYADVEGHWDQLMIRSWATIDGERVLYQESSVATLRTPRDLIRKHTGTDTLPAGTLMFCGTPGAIGGIRPATRFEMELNDPVLNRSLTHGYDIEVLPVIS
jgi:2-keto-4-pentenoate hydratase/2-oxohepta-3-ene-1,7-dioic acid hydratase in catechol pathway